MQSQIFDMNYDIDLFHQEIIPFDKRANPVKTKYPPFFATG